MRTLTAPVDLDELADLCRRDEFFWLDLSEPELEQFDGMADVLHLHPLAVEDTREFGQRPKVDAYAQQLLLVYFGATADEQEFPEAVEVHLLISGSFVVTVHRRPCGRFEEMRRTLERRPAENQHQLIYRVIDALTDSILDVLEHVAARVEAHEAEVYNRPRSRDRDQMAMLRQSLAGLRRVMVIQRQVFERAVEEVTSLPGCRRPPVAGDRRDRGGPRQPRRHPRHLHERGPGAADDRGHDLPSPDRDHRLLRDELQLADQPHRISGRVLGPGRRRHGRQRRRNRCVARAQWALPPPGAPPRSRPALAN
jgi:hypothetical protein